MATFDELVLEISLIKVAESLHAKFYLYEINFLPSGVSVVAFSVEDTECVSVVPIFEIYVFLDFTNRNRDESRI